ncbi:hypothetical protein ACLESO_13815 [Pyxidicoccus sp. 3LG]
MSSIRRVLSGISSSISRARLDVDVEPVTPLAPREPLDPVAPVRRGFSDQSDFQAEVDDLDGSLEAHAPHLEGYSAPGVSGTSGASGASGVSGASGTPPPQQLRVFAGESSFESAFESAAPRYAQLLGSQLTSAFGAPREEAGGATARGVERSAGSSDMDDMLSPETAAWELQNLDTSTPSVVEPEDLLFMLDPPGSAGPSEPALELGLEDIFEESPLVGADVAGLDDTTTSLGDAYAARFGPPELLAPSMSPAGPDEFVADTGDLGTLVPDEPSVGDAALAGVLGPLAANPAAASVPVATALASQGVEVVADTVEADFQAAPPVEVPTVEQDASVVVDPSLLEKTGG